MGNLYEGPYGYHYLKRPPTIVPVLAAEMPKISKDGLTYTIRIRKGVQYASNPCFGWDKDGALSVRTVKAADFVFALKRCADWHVGGGLGWAFLRNRVKGLDEWNEKTKQYRPRDLSRYKLPIAGLRAPDKLTLQIELTRPWPQFIHVLSLPYYGPVPQEAADFWFLGRWAPRGSERLPPVFGFTRGEQELPGTGPYILKSFTPGAPIVMVRNRKFRNQLYPNEGQAGDKRAGLLDDAGKAVPFIDEIRWSYVEELPLKSFFSGMLDIARVPNEMLDKLVTPTLQLRPEWTAKGIILDRSMEPAIYWLVFNVEDPILGGSKALRQAMCLSYDVKKHIRELYAGRGMPARAFVPSCLPEHDLAPSPYARYDLAAAKKKIKQAKQQLAAKGLLDDGEIPALRLDLPPMAPRSAMQAEFVKRQFAQLGLKVKPIFNDWPRFQEKVHAKEAQLYPMGWHADYPDAQDFLQLFWSENIRTRINSANYASPAYDRLYGKFSTMFPSKERTQIVGRMLRILNEDCPVLLLSESIRVGLRWKWLRNYKPRQFGYGYARYMRVDTALRARFGRNGPPSTRPGGAPGS